MMNVFEFLNELNDIMFNPCWMKLYYFLRVLKKHGRKDRR